MIRKVIRDHLIADSNVADLLNTYLFSSSSVEAPAVFTTRQIPDDAKYPAALITQISGPRFGCRAQRGSEINVDVDIYDDKDQSGKPLDLLALRIWQSLDRADLTTGLAAEGFEEWGCIAEMPTQTNDPDDFPGYTIRVTVRVLET